MKLNYKKIQEAFPEAIALLKEELFLSNNRTKLLNFFDNNRVRVYTGYGASGGHSINVYRAKTSEEFKKDNPSSNTDVNWRMTRIGWIQSYSTRQVAEQVGFILAFKELNFLITNKESEVDLDELLKGLR